ncbi:helix-turn-helix domain-containing protein [Anaerotignum sp. MB30-C6]|uniref:helix-turn-helix domain-containing protein n=1 Tax=Anaerotignum sp. MB30-C6 TaxID=3070814 RepID=UPI0027DD9A7A|nr:XRE family transcriptional regulator [Anaerotignum sp. MB30-C6]WMI81242.1 XRE family transcriptional regulator [Anaerotignum sp. MB30-C6]
MEISQIIGENLNRLRKERALSLGQLAELCDISKVLLSQIEKGDNNPTINTIWKIANGLKVPYTALLEKPEHDTYVISKKDIPVQYGEKESYRTFCYYTNGGNRNFELYQIELDVGEQATCIGHSEKSEEYIMVLSGELTLTVKDEEYVLKKDDAISFIASTEHSYYSNGRETLKAVILNYYPTNI